MKNIFIYTGKGAYQAKDIENFLAVFDYDYTRICQHELAQMGPQDIFIVPGGRIRDYLVAWGEVGVKKIQSFVEQGGVYIGICAGAYVAGAKYEKIPGLGFTPESFEWTEYHSIVSVSDKAGVNYKLIAENGPIFNQNMKGTVLLWDNKKQPQAIEINQGLGRLILFAAHPEGSVYDQKPPQKFSGAVYLKKLLERVAGD